MKNTTTNKDFNLVKAQLRCIDYIKARQAAKTECITDLICLQNFFKETSIVDYKIALSRRYHKKTVEDVLSDIGYKLVSFSYVTLLDGSKKDTRSVITFTNAEED